MRSSEDFPHVKRLDDAATIELFSGAASAMVSCHLMEAQQAEKLRLSLSTLQFGDLAETSLFTQLAEQQDEFTQTLLIRYGLGHFWRNLLRYSIKRYLHQIHGLLLEASKQCVQKSQISLNRHFVMHLAGKAESRVLMAAVLIDYAEVLANICSDVQELAHRAGKLLPSDFASKGDIDRSIDEHFAKAIGFVGTETVLLPYNAEISVKNSFVANLDHLCQISRETLEQFQHNKGREDTSKLLVLCDALQSRVQAFSAFQFPKTHDIGALEARRMDLLVLLSSITGYLNNYLSQFLVFVSKASALETSHVAAESITRAVANAMLQKGVLAAPAIQAAHDLIVYCEKHHITPDKLIVAELTKINPHLTIEALQVFTNLTLGSNVAGSSSHEKQHSLKRSEELTRVFASLATQLLPLLLVIPLLGGCGVKMEPESELIDFRPAIEYHNAPRPDADHPGKTSETHDPKKQLPLKEK